jgi:hypothetical protein
VDTQQHQKTCIDLAVNGSVNFHRGVFYSCYNSAHSVSFGLIIESVKSLAEFAAATAKKILIASQTCERKRVRCSEVQSSGREIEDFSPA